MSSNTCGQTTTKKSTGYMAENIKAFDSMFGEKMLGRDDERVMSHLSHDVLALAPVARTCI
jgi:hypothetical protein